MTTSRRYFLSIIMIVVVVVVFIQLWNYYAAGPWTRDGKIRAEISQLAAQVPGSLVSLKVVDNQQVAKGQLLLQIDDADYKIALAQSQAELSDLNVSLKQAQDKYRRRTQLSGAISREELEASKDDMDSLLFKIKQAESRLEKARLDLQRTRVYAPADGFISNLTLREGDYINSGQALLAMVDTQSFYALGYFEETKMPHVKVGKKVRVRLYVGGKDLTGEVSSIGHAIVDQSSSTGAQLLSQVEPNYPWVRLAQRIPVRIRLDSQSVLQNPTQLIAGSTCTINIVD